MHWMEVNEKAQNVSTHDANCAPYSDEEVLFKPNQYNNSPFMFFWYVIWYTRHQFCERIKVKKFSCEESSFSSTITGIKRFFPFFFRKKIKLWNETGNPIQSFIHSFGICTVTTEQKHERKTANKRKPKTLTQLQGKNFFLRSKARKKNVK